MQRHGLMLRISCLIILAALLAMTLRERPYIQLLFSFKYGLYMTAGFIAIVLLASRRVTKTVRIVFLFIFFYLFGMALGIHPSPLCALTKAALRYKLSGYIPPPMLVMGAVMLLLTVAGNKIFCGWICPLGSMQEAVFLLTKKVSRWKCAFVLTNSVRASLFGLFVVVLYAWNSNIYDFFNPFELFHWHFTPPLAVIVSLVLAASVLLYRPFCQFVCPAGLITWIFEHLSLSAVQKIDAKCTFCKTCVRESPCNAIEGIISGRKLLPDCFACGACIASCPEDALTFSLR